MKASTYLEAMMCPAIYIKFGIGDGTKRNRQYWRFYGRLKQKIGELEERNQWLEGERLAMMNYPKPRRTDVS